MKFKKRDVGLVLASIFVIILFIWSVIARSGGIKGFEKYTSIISITLLIIAIVWAYFKDKGKK